MRLELTQEILKELLHYDPETGIFTWKEREAKWFKDTHQCNAWNAKRRGKVAGCTAVFKRGKTYIVISVFKQHYLAHRLAHLYINGSFPEQVDHENGNGVDNRWSNIWRGVNNTENSRNARRPKNNTSGVVGVYFEKRRGRWVAEIKVDRVKIHLGYFDTLDDAAKARKQAEKEHGFHPRHGEVRPL